MAADKSDGMRKYGTKRHTLTHAPANPSLTCCLAAAVLCLSPHRTACVALMNSLDFASGNMARKVTEREREGGHSTLYLPTAHTHTIS